MMDVHILIPYGDRFGRQHKPGDVAEFPDHIALKLIANGVAAPVKESTVETVEAGPSETAARTVKPKPRTRTRKV